MALYVLVCGDRNWTDPKPIKRELAKLTRLDRGHLDPLIIVHGASRGADMVAHDVARELGLEVFPYPAEWSTYGRAAGPIRNEGMLKAHPIAKVLAFHPDLAKSKGTADMVRRAKKYGIPVEVIRG